jgi:hypothetical protein
VSKEIVTLIYDRDVLSNEMTKNHSQSTYEQCRVSEFMSRIYGLSSLEKSERNQSEELGDRFPMSSTSSSPVSRILLYSQDTLVAVVKRFLDDLSLIWETSGIEINGCGVSSEDDTDE